MLPITFNCGLGIGKASYGQRMPVLLEGVPRHDVHIAQSPIRNPQSAIMSQPAVPFDGDYVTYARGEDGRQAPLRRPDHDHDVPGRRIEGVDDALQDVPVGEEVLAEGRGGAGTPWRIARRGRPRG